MKISTSKEREVEKQPTVPEPYQHPPAIQGHVYMITRGMLKGTKYYAVLGNEIGQVRLYNLDSGVRWSTCSTFENSTHQWKDITDKVYLNTDGLEDQK
ncbi:MAG: hypothetical protein GY820_18635 [Gammaproteobacteria bacterium]|nr:hypothetical protein [Gammaproteobacteria bacterium]